MAGQFEYEREREEVLFIVRGTALEGALAGLFPGRLEPGVLHYLDWADGAPQVAACWLPPDRLELRIPMGSPWPERLAERLSEVRAGSFPVRLEALIARVEAWSYADSEVTAGAEDIAAELVRLSAVAPSRESQHEIQRAQDALDDGLPAETVAAALYRARMRA